MKKKGKTSIVVKICILFSTVILFLSILFLWLSSTHKQFERLNMPTPHTKEPLPIAATNKINDNAAGVEKSVVLNTAVPVQQAKQPIALKAPTTGDQIHFIHIPKCGGTTMTTLLRQIQCNADPVRNADCCLNPGFCDWHAHRRCSTIMGCINHFPNRKLIYKPMKSIAVFREPISRLISAWFYRGHSPNQDFFQVRPEFKEIHDGKRPRVVFAEYLEMHEYQNIQTRMLGADSFPYRNITITEEIFAKAVDALAHIFFVGLQEEFQISSEALVRAMDMTQRMPQVPEIKKERDHNSAKVSQEKADLRTNAALMQRAREVNQYDLRLYELAVAKFCAAMEEYPDLLAKVRSSGKVNCHNIHAER